jgi:D-ornithine 4,5-aminomutase subunit alpha
MEEFKQRREHLKSLTDAQLKERFWQLTEQMVDPLIELARTHTTPAIERSVLLRMGFSSLEAKALVEGVINHQLMGKGAGHVVYKLSLLRGINIREAGVLLIEGEGWEEVITSFRGDGSC